MGARAEFPAGALPVLAALWEQPSQWRHGYTLARRARLGSGTLYRVLIRLADLGLIETCWRGSPRRHMYRLTAAGTVAAIDALTAAQVRAVAEAMRAIAGRKRGLRRGGQFPA